MSCDKHNAIRTMCHLAFDSNTEATRVVVAIGSLLWGIMLLMPGNTFDRPMFSVLHGTASENLWGMMFLLHGVVASISIVFSRCGRICFVFDGVTGCLLWTTVTIGMLLSSVYNPTMPEFSFPAATSPAIAVTLAAWWLLFRYPRVVK